MRIQRLLLGMVRTNCYLVFDEDTKKAVIIDPADEAERIRMAVEELKLVPEAILLTHGHFDHILAAAELRSSYHAPVGCLLKEKELLADAVQNVSARFLPAYGMEADEYYTDGQQLPYLMGGIQVIETPGHTGGSACYYFPKEQELFSGDTLFYETIGRTDLPTGSAAKLQSSITKKLFVLPDECRVHPGHGQDTTIGHEKQYNLQILREADDYY